MRSANGRRPALPALREGVPQGTVLFREGEPGKEMYVVQQGRVTISKKVGDVEKILASLGPGEFFGEMSILNNKPRSATATCAEDSKLLVIDAKTFEAMIRGNAEIAIRMIKKLADRLAEANEQIENLLFADASSRVVHFLATAAEKVPKGAGRARARRRSRGAAGARRREAGAGRRGADEAPQVGDRRRSSRTGSSSPTSRSCATSSSSSR